MADEEPLPTLDQEPDTPPTDGSQVVAQQGVTRMATTDAANVAVGVTGAVYVADEGTAAPADIATSPATGWAPVGYISEDGVTESYNIETDDIVAWQNADVVRKVITSSEVTYGFTMIETNATSVGLYYGKDVAAAAETHMIGGALVGKKAFLIDVIDGDQTIRRYIPSGEVTERGEVAITSGDAIGYEVTLTAYPAASLSGAAVKVDYAEGLA